MAWTEQQIQTLKKMWGNGYSASEIAKCLGGGLTRNAVIGKAHRMKLSASAATNRTIVSPPSKTQGVVMTPIKKVSKRHNVMRTLPPLPSTTPVQRATNITDAALRPIEVAIRSEGIPVTRAGERHCRWPIGDPRSPDFRFCGCDIHEGLPYCTQHARVAYQTVSRRTRANANADAALKIERSKKAN